ncbi:hypothetical protein [Photobacterium lutimaris]|uniref:DUF2489 domain-containing protein n=1 Tax=Photobacterium lutimaris TaxID=388278 RepID=A0A2T3IY37_9GAMM|nr:hypothetical protein [Photobacterium lutimaris]PSU33501.1 hypothetical protein C9I99_12015 [Photobacterium lutimaris]TDR74669.1 hypothetical protein DFP78_107257 [Photobacterium lutimaris]
MTKEEVTLYAAIVAACTSIVSLVFNSKLTILREKRMLLWSKELDRINELEEKAGLAVEIVLNYSSPSILKSDYPPVQQDLKYIAGRFARYPELSSTIRDLRQYCDITYGDKIDRQDFQESAEKVSHYYSSLIEECDKITKRDKT